MLGRIKNIILKNKTLIKGIVLLRKKRLKKKHNASFGSGVYISKSTYCEGYNYFGHQAHITGSKIGYASYISDGSYIKNTVIGKFSSIGPNVRTVFGKHPSNTFVSTHPSFFSVRNQVGFSFTKEQRFKEFEEAISKNEPYSISIGNDVWIGSNVLIMDGITIGDGAIIAAGSVVVKNIEPYTIVGGVPAKKIKNRFKDEEINFLMEFQWWNKSIDWLKDNHAFFDNIESFINKFKHSEQ